MILRTLVLTLLLALPGLGEELTVFATRRNVGELHAPRYEVVLSVEPVRSPRGRAGKLRQRLQRKLDRMRGEAKRFVVANAEQHPVLAELYANPRQLRVEGDFDRKAGTATLDAVLSPRAVTLTGVLVEEVPYSENGKQKTSQGLAVGGKTIAIPGLHHFGNLKRVLGREVTVRGLYFDADDYLRVQELAASLTEETVLSRLATEYGGGVEGSPMVSTDHELAAGTPVWVSAAHPIHYGDYVDVRDADGRAGLAIPEVLAPRVDPAAPRSLQAPQVEAKAPAQGVTEALERARD